MVSIKLDPVAKLKVHLIPGWTSGRKYYIEQGYYVIQGCPKTWRQGCENGWWKNCGLALFLFQLYKYGQIDGPYVAWSLILAPFGCEGEFTQHRTNFSDHPSISQGAQNLAHGSNFVSRPQFGFNISWDRRPPRAYKEALPREGGDLMNKTRPYNWGWRKLSPKVEISCPSVDRFGWNFVDWRSKLVKVLSKSIHIWPRNCVRETLFKTIHANLN